MKLRHTDNISASLWKSNFLRSWLQSRVLKFLTPEVRTPSPLYLTLNVLTCRPLTIDFLTLSYWLLDSIWLPSSELLTSLLKLLPFWLLTIDFLTLSYWLLDSKLLTSWLYWLPESKLLTFWLYWLPDSKLFAPLTLIMTSWPLTISALASTSLPYSGLFVAFNFDPWLPLFGITDFLTSWNLDWLPWLYL